MSDKRPATNVCMFCGRERQLRVLQEWIVGEGQWECRNAFQCADYIRVQAKR